MQCVQFSYFDNYQVLLKDSLCFPIFLFIFRVHVVLSPSLFDILWPNFCMKSDCLWGCEVCLVTCLPWFVCTNAPICSLEQQIRNLVAIPWNTLVWNMPKLWGECLIPNKICKNLPGILSSEILPKKLKPFNDTKLKMWEYHSNQKIELYVKS